MRRITIWVVTLLALGLVVGCSDDQEKVEEPVQPAQDEGVPGDKSEEGEAADSFEMPDGDDAGAVDDAAPATPAPNAAEDDSSMELDGEAPAASEAPVANPTTQVPPPQPSGGGIISSGNKWDDCKKIAKFGDRKKCFAEAQKASKATK